MICYADQHKLLKPFGGNSGAIPSCVATPFGFLLGCKMTKKDSKEYYITVGKAKRRRFRKENLEICHQKDKASRNKYKEKRSAHFKQYYQEHKDYFRSYEKEKAKVNLSFRFAKNLRCRIWHAISRKWIKSERTSELVGCSLLELRTHLEKQFQCGMSWDNYGKWHIDHIKPCMKFDLTKLSERQQCFHYSNLQPLWATENLAKGGR